MQTLSQRIESLSQLGQAFQNRQGDAWQYAIHKAHALNKWFTIESIHAAFEAFAQMFLQKEKILKWIEPYGLPDERRDVKQVGIVMAGNIPMVGFHDWLCVYLSGHYAQIKLSEKDNVLLPFVWELIGDIDAESLRHFEVVEKLKDFDAVIATGSNNSARYFDAYFGKYPHIIRKNRNAVAVLSGKESPEELQALGKDIFLYFGLGCRNVSKIYVPEGYDFSMLLSALDAYSDLKNHSKYKNNFDYNYSLLILNQIPHYANDCILLKEDSAIVSRIGTLHYEFYNNTSDLSKKLQSQQEEIQCIVASSGLLDMDSLAFGQAQSPRLEDYADGVDTMAFLVGL